MAYCVITNHIQPKCAPYNRALLGQMAILFASKYNEIQVRKNGTNFLDKA